MSYPGHSLGVESYPSTEKQLMYSTAPADWASTLLVDTGPKIEYLSMAQKTRVPAQNESCQRLQKWYLMPPCLTVSIIWLRSRVKWSNPGKGEVPSLTPQCCSYWKGTLWVALNYSCRRTLLEKQGQTHKRCILMDPHTWPCKSRTTSTNIHSAAMWGYGM